jgi:Zn-dependent membrane protease YugP
MWFNTGYFIFMLPAMALALIATIFTKFTFSRYSRTSAASGLTGAEAAARLLRSQGVTNVSIEPVQGFLSDHYDPTSRTLRLSPAVYDSSSLSAIGVACHEAGHALQHAKGFAPLALRSTLVPAAQFASNASYIFLMLGFMLNTLVLVKLGAVIFTLTVVFALVTLPVEWDASSRAKRLMTSSGIVAPSEATAAGRVLNAAFLTYVASAVTAILQLLYFLIQAGILGRRRD